MVWFPLVPEPSIKTLELGFEEADFIRLRLTAKSYKKTIDYGAVEE